ncbi:flagellar filament capping protein FliD [Desulfovibrio sp. OttesenSCG-928-C06]|nr:flagellar filament capping protein FliD [Desulfovibrio sp. OttesenSCG-928-C06]
MARYTESGAISIAGLGNGTDFSEMIAELKKIEQRHGNQLKQWRSDWKSRLDAFGELRTALEEYSSFMKTMNSEDKFLVKSAVSSNAAVCAATNTTGALDGVYQVDVTSLASASYLTIGVNATSMLDKVNGSGAPQDFIYTYGTGSDQKTCTISVGPETTLQGLVNLINNDTKNPGVGATVMEMGGKYYLQMYSLESGAGTDIDIDPAVTGWSGFTGGAVSTTAGSDAVFSLNGHPFTSTSNSISAWGMTFNLNSTGTTTLSVSTDTETIKENVEKFVEETNKVRSLLIKMTSVNEGKSVVDPDYADSQLEMQMGSVLTGNYGVQLVKSMFNTSTISQGAGFEYLTIDGDTFTGDIFSSLAQIGIKTDHQSGSPTFGQLIFEEDESLMTLDKALATSPWGVAELFSAKKKTYSDSDDFMILDEYSLFSYVEPGKYDFTYDCDSLGNVSNVRIDGIPVTANEAGLYSLNSTTHPAGGLMFMINDTTPGSHGGVARVKDGKFNELIDLVDKDFLRAYNSSDKNNNGMLSILEEQYKEIIKGIDDKLMREEERIIKWERNMKSRFARLDAVLKQYENLQSQLETQIKQLSSGSSD